MKRTVLVFLSSALLFLTSCTNEEGKDQEKLDLPTLITLEVINIGPNFVEGGLDNIDNKGKEIISKGLCWSINENPTIEDTKLNIDSASDDVNIRIDGLDAETEYFLRAFATTKSGTGYGNEVSFTTTIDITPTCQVQENTLYFDDMLRNFTGVLYTAPAQGLFYGDYGVWGSGTQGDLSIEFNSPPETGIYPVNHNGSFIESGNCAVTGVFKPLGEFLSHRFTAQSADDAFVFVLKTGEGQYSMTFCNLRFVSGSTAFTFNGSYGNLKTTR